MDVIEYLLLFASVLIFLFILIAIYVWGLRKERIAFFGKAYCVFLVTVLGSFTIIGSAIWLNVILIVFAKISIPSIIPTILTGLGCIFWSIWIYTNAYKIQPRISTEQSQ